MSSYEVISSLSNQPNLNNSDIDLHISNNLNFSYYSVHDFHDNQDISSMKNPFSLLHCNIRSLQANHDNLVDLIKNLDFDFSIDSKQPWKSHIREISKKISRVWEF